MEPHQYTVPRIARIRMVEPISAGLSFLATYNQPTRAVGVCHTSCALGEGRYTRKEAIAMTVAKEQIRVWVSPETKAFLEQRAAQQGRALSEVACEMLEQSEAQLKVGEASPWLEGMIDAVLSKYFHGFPEVLDQLVMAAFEQRKWAGSEYVRLLELTGDKNIESQDQRVAKLSSQIQGWARSKADDFFQGLAGPEELIEPDDAD